MKRKIGDANPENLCRGSSEGAPGGPNIATHGCDKKPSLMVTGSAGTFYGQKKLNPVLGVCPENASVNYHGRLFIESSFAPLRF